MPPAVTLRCVVPLTRAVLLVPRARLQMMSTDLDRKQSQGWTKFGVGLVLGGTIIPIIKTITGALDRWKRTKDPDVDAANTVLRSTIAFKADPDLFVERPIVTGPIQDFLDRPGSTCLVVVGPRGGGKTTAVQDAVKDKKGVVSITVTDDKQPVYSTIGKILGVDDFEAKSEEHISAVFDDASKRSGRPEWRPTLIVEVDRQATDNVAGNAVGEVIRLATDHAAAKAIVVLSDPNDCLALPFDDDRQEFVWVEDFTIEQANNYFNKCGFLVPSDPADVRDPMVVKRREVFAEVGTRPAALGKMVSHGEDEVDQLIQHKKLKADKEISALVNYEPEPGESKKVDGSSFAKLIDALMKTTDSEGVRRGATAEFLAAPEYVSKVLKKHHGVVYHSVTDTYRFFSPAHRRASERSRRAY